jgi:alkylation response protein AidB-like acyl-CoA dehydrogenase
MQRTIFSEEHLMFRDAVRRFIQKEVSPFHAQWEKAGILPRELWLKAGASGFLCMDVPEEYGGGGIQDFRYNAILAEELTRANCTGPGFGLHNDVAAPYILHYGTDERRWLGWRTGADSGVR